MGSRNSSESRQNMDEDDPPQPPSNSERRESSSSNASALLPENPDLASILSYLIRSGQVRIRSSDWDDDDDDPDVLSRPNPVPTPDTPPDTHRIYASDLRQQILMSSGQGTGRPSCKRKSMSHLLQKREVGDYPFNQAERCAVASNFLPNTYEVMAKYSHKAFCGTYSQDGNIFLTACQDRTIRVYDTNNGSFKLRKQIPARDVGWSILDVAFSPDGHYMIYSSWSDSIHLCAVDEDKDTHEALRLYPEADNSFCLFSLAFSQDNQEIMGGANDGSIYVYDRQRNTRSLKIDAHEDDVNAVAFADASSQILFSGSDDGLCKVWDRRTLREEDPHPVGTLAGHTDGITFIDSKRDNRYLISNCKDQTIKLWDMRCFSSNDAVVATRREVNRQNWDYRWQQVPGRVYSPRPMLPGDSSLMTYRGHCILNTLVRCHFSPAFTTGQRYIYTGCATGAVIVYDVLTGERVKHLDGHRACVRDVSWHPYENCIMSTSWDSTINRWYYEEVEDEELSMLPEEYDGEDDGRKRRRSQRLLERRRFSKENLRSGLRRLIYL